MVKVRIPGETYLPLICLIVQSHLPFLTSILSNLAEVWKE